MRILAVQIYESVSESMTLYGTIHTSWFQGIEEAGGLRHVVVNTSAGRREGGSEGDQEQPGRNGHETL